MEIRGFCTSFSIRKDQNHLLTVLQLSLATLLGGKLFNHQNSVPRVAAGHCCFVPFRCCCRLSPFLLLFESTLVAVLLLLSLSRSAAAAGYCGETSSVKQSKLPDKEVGQFINTTHSLRLVTAELGLILCSTFRHMQLNLLWRKLNFCCEN